MELEEDSSGDGAEKAGEAAEEATEEGALEGEVDVVVPEQTLRDYAGDYVIKGAGMVLSFSFKDDTLMFTTEGQPELAMVPQTQTRFHYKGIEAWIEFSLDEEGKVTGGVHIQGGAEHQLERVPPYDPLPGELEAYSGRYLSDELETFYQLRVRDSTLVVKIRNTDDIDLEPLTEDLFKGSVNFQGEVEFIRNEEGLITGFKVSNGRTKGILFRRL